MSGHNKWSQIKRTKGINDAARGRVFTKLGKEIHVAVKSGGGDPAGNSKLRDVIAKCKASNMPNDNIQRCIKNAVGDAGRTNYENITYEGFGPGGVAVMVHALTDNKNRTASEIRHTFDKFGGSLGVSGSVSYIFVEIEGEYLSEFTVSVPDDKAASFEKLLDMLDENEDVQDVWHNAE